MVTKKAHRVLIVDDDEAVRETVCARLRRNGHYVLGVESAESALKQVESRHPRFDVVITDVHMSHITGLELAAQLLERYPQLRVIVVSGDRDAAIARKAIEIGVNSFLFKPFELSELEAIVNEL
jgi:DNA-binding NtrC family response regulator